MSLVTLYTLFFDDIRVVSLPKSLDDSFNIVTTICFGLFLAEIIAACLCRKDYFWTFFFWLDVVSTLSMLPDISWFWDSVTGESSNSHA